MSKEMIEIYASKTCSRKGLTSLFEVKDAYSKIMMPVFENN